MTGFMAPVILNFRFDLKKSNNVNILVRNIGKDGESRIPRKDQTFTP
jgi:hypothetical protein